MLHKCDALASICYFRFCYYYCYLYHLLRVTDHITTLIIAVDMSHTIYNEQYVREAYAYFFPEQECDSVTVFVCNFTTEKIV